jgi:hypothetical protein
MFVLRKSNLYLIHDLSYKLPLQLLVLYSQISMHDCDSEHICALRS